MDYFKTSIENLVNPYQVNDPNSHLELPLPAELLFDDMGILSFLTSSETALLNVQVEKDYLLLFKREFILTATTLRLVISRSKPIFRLRIL